MSPPTNSKPAYESVILTGLKCGRMRREIATAQKIATDRSLSYADASQLLLALFSAAAVSCESGPLPADLPRRRVVFAHQPWFNLNLLQLFSQAWARGILLPVFAGVAATRRKSFRGVRVRDFRECAHRDVNLWEVSQYRLAQQLGEMPASISPAHPAHLPVMQAVYGEAIELIDEAAGFLALFRPDTVIIAQGYDLPAAVLRHLAVRAGLRVVALENIFHRERLLWDDVSGVAVNLNLARNYYWRYRDFVPAGTAARTTAGYLAKIETLKSAEHASPTPSGREPLKDGRPTITYIGQVGVDSSVLFGLRQFESQIEVISTLAEFAAEQSLRLLVKLHPKESPHFNDPLPHFRELTARQLARHAGFCASRERMGENLVLDGENRLNTYEMIRQADVCVTINSQAGLEALLHGKEVVLAGDAFYGGLGFTHEVNDPVTLRLTLGRILRDKHRLNEGTRAQAFFHIFTEYYCLPKTEESVLRLAAGRPDFAVVPRNAPAAGEPNGTVVAPRFAKTTPARILILGGAGDGNLGDEALLLAAVQGAKAAVPEAHLTVATPDRAAARCTLAGLTVDLVPAPRRCLFRIDQDASYWAAGKMFQERWAELRAFLSSGGPETLVARIRQGAGPAFVDRAGTIELLSAVARASAVVLHGGGILASATRSRLWDGNLVALLCRQWKKPLFLRGQQLGPIDGAEDAQRLREILAVADRTIVRDVGVSREVAEKILPGIRVDERPDDALFAILPAEDDAAVLARNDLTRHRYLAISYRANAAVGVNDEFAAAFAAVCRAAAEIFALPLVLVPLGPADRAALEQLAPVVGTGARVFQPASAAWESAAVLANAAIAIAVPHHALIFALRGGVPILSPVSGGNYAHKNRGSMEFFGLADNVGTDHLNQAGWVNWADSRLRRLHDDLPGARDALQSRLTVLAAQRVADENQFWAAVRANRAGSTRLVA